MTKSEQELLRQFDLNPDFGPSIGEESSSSLDSTASVEATTCMKKFTNSSSYCVVFLAACTLLNSSVCRHGESYHLQHTVPLLIAITYVCMMSPQSLVYICVYKSLIFQAQPSDTGKRLYCLYQLCRTACHLVLLSHHLLLADITRLERWERAAKYGKSPPPMIRELILKHPDNKDIKER